MPVHGRLVTIPASFNWCPLWVFYRTGDKSDSTTSVPVWSFHNGCFPKNQTLHSFCGTVLQWRPNMKHIKHLKMQSASRGGQHIFRAPARGQDPSLTLSKSALKKNFKAIHQSPRSPLFLPVTWKCSLLRVRSGSPASHGHRFVYCQKFGLGRVKLSITKTGPSWLNKEKLFN